MLSQFLLGLYQQFRNSQSDSSTSRSQKGQCNRFSTQLAGDLPSFLARPVSVEERSWSDQGKISVPVAIVEDFSKNPRAASRATHHPSRGRRFGSKTRAHITVTCTATTTSQRGDRDDFRYSTLNMFLRQI